MNIHKIISEEIDRCINNIICESQESKSQSKAIKLAMQYGMDRERAEQFVRIDLRNDLSELRHSNTAKFTLGCTRLFFENQLVDAKTISLLNSILKLITEKYYDKFDQNLNNLSFNDLANQFTQELEYIEKKNKDEVNSKEYVNRNYEIIPINSFEEAQNYYQYLYKESPWCITYREDMWDNYTNNDNNQVYFCLKNGFENMMPPEETGNPKDEYGLSMISIIVDESGKLAYSTTRWNHANNASGDHDLTVQETSNIIGVNFYNTFKPNNNFNDLVSESMQRLFNGEDINDIFDDVDDFGNDLTLVGLKGRYNIINKNYKLLSNLWFDSIGFSNNGLFRVGLGNKYNFIDINGNILYHPNNTDEWFDKAKSFKNDFALIKLYGKYNFIDVNGNILYKPNNPHEWFDEAYDFNQGFAMIYQKGKFNFIDVNGNILYEPNNPNEWFDEANNFKSCEFAIIYKNGKYNFIGRNGNFLYKSNNPNEWFDNVSNFIDGFALIYKNGKCNFIDTNGNILYKPNNPNEWFDDVNYFNFNGFAEVKLNDKEYVIDKEGNLTDYTNREDYRRKTRRKTSKRINNIA